MNPDIINGLFETIAGLLLCMNVYRLHKDKKVQGVSVIPTSFFMLWGYWNLYFYPSVNCVLSFWGGILVVAANTVWVIQMIHYGRKQYAAS